MPVGEFKRILDRKFNDLVEAMIDDWSSYRPDDTHGRTSPHHRVCLMSRDNAGDRPRPHAYHSYAGTPT